MQNKNNIAVTKPKTPVAIALDKMPFPATTLIKKRALKKHRASNKSDVPCVFGFFCDVTRCIKASHGPCREKAERRLSWYNGMNKNQYNDRIQFHPAGAPVPLS